MDIEYFNGEPTGQNGVFQTLVDAVMHDPRWVLRWCGWDEAGQVRNMNLAWRDNAGNPGGTVEITIKETRDGH